MFQVRILYVRNLMLDTSEERLQQVFEQALGKRDVIERVKKLKDYSFVHFKEREDALKAMEIMNGEYIPACMV